jgi:hypothetical protein
LRSRSAILNQDWSAVLDNAAFRDALSGSTGGFALFLYGLRVGHYKNNKLVRKGLLELLGATLVGGFMGHYLFGDRVLLAFAIGVAWSGTVGAIRDRVTRIVLAALARETRE